MKVSCILKKYKMLMNKTIKDLNKWIDILCLLVERTNKDANYLKIDLQV